MPDITQTMDYLTILLKSAITGEELPRDIDFEARFDDIISLASSHEVAQLAALPLISSDVIKDETHRKIAEKHMFDASYREAKNRYTYDLAEKILVNAKIAYVPLKGFIIKDYYPERWMRTSCDIDILVKKKDFDNAVSHFTENGFTADGNINYHDVSLLYDDTNLELHFSVCESIKNIDAVLKNIWDYVDKSEGFKCTENSDFFIFHHIAHMSYHFLSGGCGIRPFLDLWILKRAGFFDYKAVQRLCERAKIDEFLRAVMELIDAWFENKGHTDITLRMQKYILTGGAYGYYPNNAAAYTVRNGGKIGHIIFLAFPKYKNMCAIYPVLKRIPILLPICYVHRLLKKTFSQKDLKAKKKYKIIKNQDKAFIEEVSTLIKMLKLDK